jgi:hypothetical protein
LDYDSEYSLQTAGTKAISSASYTMGSPDARAYSRNKRGIAGSLIWINFDRHALLNLFYQAGATFLCDQDETGTRRSEGVGTTLNLTIFTCLALGRTEERVP